MSTEDVIGFLAGLEQEIHNHRDYEYEVEYYSGYKDTLLVGTKLRRYAPIPRRRGGRARAYEVSTA